MCPSGQILEQIRVEGHRSVGDSSSVHRVIGVNTVAMQLSLLWHCVRDCVNVSCPDPQSPTHRAQREKVIKEM